MESRTVRAHQTRLANRNALDFLLVVMLDLQHRPKLQKYLHWFFAGCGLLLSAQSDLPSVLHFLPEGSMWPKYAGYLMALAAFSRILGRKAGLDTAVPEPAAPGKVIPFSEAKTVVERPDPKKSA